MRAVFTLLLVFATTTIQAADYSAATGGEPNAQAMTFVDYKEVLQLFDELGYTDKRWQAGIRKVPRLYLSEISDRWSKKTSREITVQLKKELFFRSVGPLALRSNELILGQRARLKKLLAKQDNLTAGERQWLEALAEQYGLDVASYPDPNGLEEALLPRVDVIPPSLILAQAAEESGWGTSRFAFTGNALFGQWTWGGKGIRPEQQREGKGDYKIAAFDAPLQSVQAHARNLNTHHAYLQFRIKRAQIRANNNNYNNISGYDLAGSLTSYSERGQEYVKTLRSIISYNKLQAADNAFLSSAQAIVMVPQKAVTE
jgi:Bax protein